MKDNEFIKFSLIFQLTFIFYFIFQSPRFIKIESSHRLMDRYGNKLGLNLMDIKKAIKFVILLHFKTQKSYR